MDVHSTGGGIQYTVAHTQQATETELYNSLKLRLRQMLSNGTTLIECKSGYGLDVDTEIKMLKVIERARRELDIGISATFCGAHSIPKYAVKQDCLFVFVCAFVCVCLSVYFYVFACLLVYLFVCLLVCV